jgi:hypothetical protein
MRGAIVYGLHEKDMARWRTVGCWGVSARVCQHIIVLIRVCVFVLPSYMCISID